MRIKFFSSRKYEESFLINANKGKHELVFDEEALSLSTAEKTKNFDAISIFVNDECTTEILTKLHECGVRHISLRAAGYNNVDLPTAKKLGISVANVPEYSPYAVAEHTVALILALNRKLHETKAKLDHYDFTLDGLEGFDINGKTVGIIGLGRIGGVVAKIMTGFGCKILAYDVKENQDYKKSYNITYTSLEELYEKSDIITLHAPLNEQTHYLLNKNAFDKMKAGVMIVNSGRGPLLNTADAIEALKADKIGYLGLDVYEREKGIFFYNHSSAGIKDEILKKLMKMPNVIVTPHMSFLTKTALKNIADTTFENINQWNNGVIATNELT